MVGASQAEEQSLPVLEQAEAAGIGYQSVLNQRNEVSSDEPGAIVLDSRTVVNVDGNDQAVRGLIIDTGRLHELVLDNDRSLSVNDALKLANNRIVLPTTTA